MKRRMLKIFLVILLGGALILGGCLLYRVFVTDRIADKGGMENPDAAGILEETPSPAPQGTEPSE